VGIFFSSHQPLMPEINNAIRMALQADPKSTPNIEQEALQRTVNLVRVTAQQFNPLRFCAAVVIAAALLLIALWAARHNLPDISKDLMCCFDGFSGLVLGVLGGEAQKFSS
jgi:hypothetical protein